MKVLLDTHIVLWYLDDHPKLATQAKAIIEDQSNEVWISIVSLWEMAIKSSLGKLELADDLGIIESTLRRQGIQTLPVEVPHLIRLSALPFHHRDPFDRLLVAQSIEEQMILLTEDQQLSAYPSIFFSQ